MPTRLDWLAIAILSGLVARWVSKHTIGEDGKIAGIREDHGAEGIAVNYATLKTNYAVDAPRLESCFRALSEHNLLTIHRKGEQVYAKPVADNVEKLFNAQAISIPVKHSEVTMKLNTVPSGVLFAGVDPLTMKFPNAGAWLINRFAKKYAAIRGATYEFKGGRDGKAVKNLLRALAVVSMSSVDTAKEREVDRIFEFYLREQNREYFTGGYALHGLWDNWAALQCRMGKLRVAPTIEKVTNSYYR